MREPIWNELARMQDCMAVCAPLEQPCCEVTENESAWKLRLELPGISKDDLQLDVSEEGISVKVEQTAEKQEKDSFSQRYAGFYQHWPLPKGVSPEKVTAVCQNGILEIVIPKPEKPKAKRIPIQ